MLGVKEERHCLSCRHYVHRAGLTLRLDQEQLYAYLRTMMPSVGENVNKNSGCPWQFTDQPLLAEIFLLTQDEEGYRQFIASYPEIFKEENQ